MKYIIEISNLQGDDIAEEEYSIIESSEPIPIPNVSDIIYVQRGGGLDGQRAQMVKVMERLFSYSPENSSSEQRLHVQLFCESSDK